MNIAYSYAVSEEVLLRFENAQRFRRDPRQIIVADFPYQPAHSPFYLKCPEIVTVEKTRPFCISRFRNAAIEHAIQTEVDILIIGDADSVFIPETLDTSTTYSTALTAHLRQGEEPDRIKHQLEFKPCSWFILHRSIFSKYRFDESYKGYGYEDFDFYRRLKKDRLSHGPYSLLSYHLWHEPFIVREEMAANHARFLATCS